VKKGNSKAILLLAEYDVFKIQTYAVLFNKLCMSTWSFSSPCCQTDTWKPI